jgi:hypothetical protein
LLAFYFDLDDFSSKRNNEKNIIQLLSFSTSLFAQPDFIPRLPFESEIIALLRMMAIFS